MIYNKLSTILYRFRRELRAREKTIQAVSLFLEHAAWSTRSPLLCSEVSVVCPRSSTPYLSRLTGSVEPTHEGHWADSKKEVRLLTHGSRIASAKKNDEKTGQLNFFDMLNVYPASSMPNMVKETDNCEWNIVWSHFPYEFLPICKVWIAKHRRQEDCFVSKWHPDEKMLVILLSVHDKTCMFVGRKRREAAKPPSL